MPVVPVPSATSGVGVGDNAAGCVARSVVVIGEDAAGCSVACAALSEGLSPEDISSVRTYSPSQTSSAPPSPVSFSFALPSGVSTCNSLMAAPRLPNNHPQAHLRALKVQSPEVQVHQQAWALVQAWLVPHRHCRLRSVLGVHQCRRSSCTARSCRYATTVRLCYQKVETAFTAGGLGMFVLYCAPACSCCFLMPCFVLTNAVGKKKDSPKAPIFPNCKG